MFIGTDAPDGQGIDRRTFDMTRDGFTLLAMGFTGAKALKFKIRYIKAFNAMEAALKESAIGKQTPRQQMQAFAEARRWITLMLKFYSPAQVSGMIPDVLTSLGLKIPAGLAAGAVRQGDLFPEGAG